jgi:hypothetical protein
MCPNLQDMSELRDFTVPYRTVPYRTVSSVVDPHDFFYLNTAKLTKNCFVFLGTRRE